MAYDRSTDISVSGQTALGWRESTDKSVLQTAVRRLKRAVDIAWWLCLDDDASNFHDDLVSAEWRLRQAERRT